MATSGSRGGRSSAPPISLSSIEAEIAVLDERITAQKELVIALMDARDVVRTVQATKYDERLDALNHIHERQQLDQATFVSRDKFDGYLAEIGAWRATIQTQISDLIGRTSGSRAAMQTVLTVVAIILSAISIFHSFIK